MKEERHIVETPIEKPRIDKKLKVQLKGQLKQEAIILHFLVGIAIASVVVSFFLEFGIDNTYAHKGFLNNIALGVTGSAIISFVVLYIPFLDKKDKQINSISTCLFECSSEYRGKIFGLLSYNLTYHDGWSLDFEKEIDIYLRTANRIKTNIKHAIQLYHDSGIQSEQICAILEYCDINLMECMYCFETFCHDLSMRHTIHGDIEDEKIEKYCQFILNEMRTICLPEDLDELLLIFHNREEYEEASTDKAFLSLGQIAREHNAFKDISAKMNELEKSLSNKE